MTFQDIQNWVIWKSGFCRRLRKRDPVFVFQMGKVASRSVTESLQNTWPGEVVHGHRFDAEYPQGEAKELFRYWNSSTPPENLYLISLVRNPVDRNVSAFFQNFEMYTGQSPETTTMTPEEMLASFLEVFPHEIPEVWFDRKIKSTFGIDVYEQSFPSEGWAIFPHARSPLLLMRMETDDSVKAAAIREFLDLDTFQLERKNESGGKTYEEIYTRFRNEVSLPREYVESQVGTRMFQHFYTGEEEATFTKWCRA